MLMQIALGMIPGALILIVTTIFSRKNLAGRIVAFALFLVVAAGGVFIQVSDEAETAAKSKEEARGSLDMVYAMMDVGETQVAGEMLDELLSSNVYVEEFALCGARISAAEGDYKAARALYSKAQESLKDEAVKAEYNTVCDCLADTGIDKAALEKFPTYAASVNAPQTLIEKAEKARSSVGRVISAAIDAYLANKPAELVEAAKLIFEVDNVYAEYLADWDPDTAKAKAEELLSDAKGLSDTLDLLNNEKLFRLSIMKLNIICKNYSAIAAQIKDSSSYDELLIVSELYMNEYVSESDFNTEFKTDDNDVLKTVYDQLREVYNKGLENESAAVKKQVKDLIDEMGRKIGNPAFMKIETLLENFAANRLVNDRSKIYFQLSRLNYDKKNNISADNYLTDAFNTLDGCKDREYTDAACEIINIINNKDDSSALKEVPKHVNNVINNSTTIELSTELKNKNPESAPEGETEEESVGFETYLSDYVSRKRTAINIINVDASSFPKVSFTVGVDGDVAYSAEQLKSILSITDCGEEITDFTVENMSYENINIVLVCDTSGSMSGAPIEDLKKAAELFVNNRGEKENIGLVTFTSSIDKVLPLTSTTEALLSAIQNIYSGGGTNIFDATFYANGMILGAVADQGNASAMNIVIVMSDGADGYNHSGSEIDEKIVQPYLSSGTVLYCIGLGSSVDADYLDSLCTPTGGEYLHVVDSQTLGGFYDYLHSMALNRYKITFTAKDTVSASRTLKVQINGDDIANDTARYSINGEEVGESTEGSTVVYQGKLVSGLDTRFLFRTGKEQTVYLNGKNFAETDSIKIELIGKLTYDIKYEYVSATQLKLTVPKNILEDSYDLRVTIGTSVGRLEDELIIGDKIEKVKVGGYEFATTSRTNGEGETTLSGYVCMNGWLCFNGDITLEGDIKADAYVIMHDTVGSYVKFDKENAKGLAKTMADRNVTLEFEPFGSIKLYNDTMHTADSDDYKVEAIPVPFVYISDFMTLSAPGLSLYPDHIELDTQKFDTKFPFQDKLFDSGKSEIFKFEYEFKILVSGVGVGADIVLDTTADTKNYRQINFGSAPIYVSPGQAKISINTYSDEYSIKLVAKLAFIDGDGVGLELKWSGRSLSAVTFLADIPVNTNISGVPVTFSKFSIGLSGIDNSKPVYKWTLSGSTDISVAKVSALLPKLEKYVGDVSVCTFDGTKITLNLGECYFKIESRFKLLGKIDIGGVEAEAGKFKYTNLMLGMEDVNVTGIRFKRDAGIKWDADNCNIDLRGESEIALTNRYVGAKVKGVCDIEVKWWVLRAGFDINGEALVGFYKDNDGDLTFTVRARSANNTGNKRKGVSITWAQGSSPEVNTKYY